MQTIANLATIISLAITILVWFSVRNIRRAFLFKARAPIHTDRLDDISHKISNLLNDYQANKNSIKELLAHAEIQLEQLLKKTSGEPRTRIRALRKRMQDRLIVEDPEAIYNVHLELIKIVDAMKEHLANQEWEIKP